MTTEYGIDSALLLRIAEGNSDAFRKLFDTFAPRIYHYAKLRSGSPHFAEEIVQETMLALWQGRDALVRCESLSAWIYSIARRKIADQWRHRERHDSLPLAGVADSLSAPETATEQGLDLLHAITQLEYEARELIFLAFYCGLTYEEVGAVLDIPIGTVKSRVHYLRIRLKESLAGAFDRREAQHR